MEDLSGLIWSGTAVNKQPSAQQQNLNNTLNKQKSTLSPGNTLGTQPPNVVRQQSQLPNLPLQPSTASTTPLNNRNPSFMMQSSSISSPPMSSPNTNLNPTINLTRTASAASSNQQPQMLSGSNYSSINSGTKLNNGSNGSFYGGLSAQNSNASINSPSLGSATHKKVESDAFDNLVSFNTNRKPDMSKIPLSKQPSAYNQSTGSTAPSPLFSSPPVSASLNQNQMTSTPVSAKSTKSTASPMAPSPSINKTSLPAPMNKDAWNFDAMLSPPSSSSAVSSTGGLNPAKSAAAPAVSVESSSGADLLSDFLSGAPVKPTESAAVHDDTFGLIPTATPPNATPKSSTQKLDRIEISPAAPSKEPPTVSAAKAQIRPSSHEKNGNTEIDALIARLCELGFNADECRHALRTTNNDFDAAVEILLTKSNNRPASSNAKSDMAARISKLTGISINKTEKATEKASQLLNAASGVSLQLFNKARNIVIDSSKKISNSRQSKNGTFAEQPESYGFSEMREDSMESISSRRSQKSLPEVEIPAAPPKKKRTNPPVSCSPDQLAAAERLKLQGNEFIKQGQYGDAENMYSKAIECIPSDHLTQIVLMNNRAAARLKTGTYKECIVDCTHVENLCLQELEYDDLTDSQKQDYKDAISKACLRRATAYENIEKWEDAGKDYKKALEWNPNAKGAHDGIRRCGKATVKDVKNIDDSNKNNMPSFGAGKADDLNDLLAPNRINETKKKDPVTKSTSGIHDLAFFAETSKQSTSSNEGKGVSIAISNGETFKSERVEQLRAQDAQKEKVDAEKLKLKDEVDSRLLNWKSKNNLRAMLASLETILWADMKSDWKPVTMAELVTPSQVKIRYMKAIGKLHPDKLSNMKLTAEQQLLANGIFSALNDAWDAFKTQNGL